MKDMLKKVFKHWEMFLVIFLILEFVVFGAANPKFLRPQSIMNSIVNYISVCIISLFVTMVMITGGIDIQAPAIIGLSSIIIGVLWSDAGLNIWRLPWWSPRCAARSPASSSPTAAFSRWSSPWAAASCIPALR